MESAFKKRVDDLLLRLNEAVDFLRSCEQQARIPGWYGDACATLNMLAEHPDLESATPSFETARQVIEPFCEKVERVRAQCQMDQSAEGLIKLAEFVALQCLAIMKRKHLNRRDTPAFEAYMSVRTPIYTFKLGAAGSEEQRQEQANHLLNEAVRLWAGLRNFDGFTYPSLMAAFKELVALYDDSRTKPVQA